MGKERCPKARRLMITVHPGDRTGIATGCGNASCAAWTWRPGSSSPRAANLPAPRSSTEYRLSSFVTIDWRGRPLTSYRTSVELAAATTTRTGFEGSRRVGRRRLRDGRQDHRQGTEGTAQHSGGLARRVEVHRPPCKFTQVVVTRALASVASARRQTGRRPCARIDHLGGRSSVG